MKILFLYNRPYIPQVSGGTEYSINDLCLIINSYNIEVSVLCNISPYNFMWFKNRLISKIFNEDFPCDNILDYPVCRGWCTIKSIGNFIEKFNPTTIVIKNGIDLNIQNYLISLNIKLVNYIRDLNDNNPLLYPNNKNINYISNSNYTRGKIKESFGVDSLVIPPLIFKDRFRIESNKRRNISFIGLHSKKGVDLAFNIAELMPELKFQFYESWSLSKKDFSYYKSKAKFFKNIAIHRRTENVSSIYNDTKILLFPSQYQETWGRVASEAHLFGIPVIGSDVGGIPESVGPGGILLPPSSPASKWAETINLLYYNHDIYNLYSRAATFYSQRKEFQPSFLVRQFINACS